MGLATKTAILLFANLMKKDNLLATNRAKGIIDKEKPAVRALYRLDFNFELITKIEQGILNHLNITSWQIPF